EDNHLSRPAHGRSLTVDPKCFQADRMHNPFKPDLSYPADEETKLNQLEILFRDWHRHFVQSGSLLPTGAADLMVWDGFYPCYFSQKVRLLFIGREARQIGGQNKMDVLCEAYRTGKKIGGRAIDGDNFHSRMLRIASGITNGMPPWQ